MSTEMQQQLALLAQSGVEVYFVMAPNSVGGMVVGKIEALGKEVVQVACHNKQAVEQPDESFKTIVTIAHWVIPMTSLIAVFSTEKEEDGDGDLVTVAAAPLSALDPDNLNIPDFLPDFHPST